MKSFIECGEERRSAKETGEDGLGDRPRAARLCRKMPIVDKDVQHRYATPALSYHDST